MMDYILGYTINSLEINIICAKYIYIYIVLCFSYYSTIWILEPALLTMISVFLLIFALVDYLVPILTSVLCNAQNWTGQKEKKLIEICQNLSVTILQVQGAWTSVSKIRHDRPNIVSEIISKTMQSIKKELFFIFVFVFLPIFIGYLIDYYFHISKNKNLHVTFFLFLLSSQYYSATILFLILFAWIGNTVNNLLLLYIIGNKFIFTKCIIFRIWLYLVLPFFF